VVVLVAFASNAALSYILTPTFGAVGAAVANAIAYVVFLVMRTEVSSLVWRPVARSRMYVAVFIYVSLALVTAAFGHLAGWFSFAGWFILFLITLVVFRAELRGVKMLFSRRAGA
jgi:O-antigen/teichoic acid export membrane protein